MAGTKYHHAATLTAAAITAGAALIVRPDVALALTAGVLVTLDVNGDKDQARRGFWWLYGKLPHRSPLSHWVGLGTVGRIVYIAVPISALIEVLNVAVVWDLYRLGLLAGGMVIGDAVHWLLDQEYFGWTFPQD